MSRMCLCIRCSPPLRLDEQGPKQSAKEHAQPEGGSVSLSDARIARKRQLLTAPKHLFNRPMSRIQNVSVRAVHDLVGEVPFS